MGNLRLDPRFLIPQISIKSRKESCVCLMGRLGSESSWMDTVVGSLFLKRLSGYESTAGSSECWVWASLLSHSYTQSRTGKGALEF